MALLELSGVDALYGRVRALRGVTISVDQGEVVALIGSNGAGKTTTLRTISGLMHPPSGSITFNGTDISRMPAHDIVGLGICQSPEGRRLFARMQVIDNLRMGAFLRKDAAGIQKDMDRVFELFPRLKERTTQLAGTLSGGEQQMGPRRQGPCDLEPTLLAVREVARVILGPLLDADEGEELPGALGDRPLFAALVRRLEQGIPELRVRAAVLA